jgi:hypothetical protein
MRKILAAIVPLVATVVLFLVLFNNVDQGPLILAGLILMNLAVILVPKNSRFGGSITIHTKAVAACCMSALATLLAIEILFPVVLPKEYAEIRDLTKHCVTSNAGHQPGASIVFTNADQKRTRNGSIKEDPTRSPKQWHAPGGRFAYYGYDPNLKARYINLFHWNSHGYYDHEYSVQRPEEVRRIVVIGDSYVEAVQVPLSRSFHKLLEKTLNRGQWGSSNTKTQVIALGNSGTGQVEHFKVLEKQGIQYEPDAVVIGLSRNDFCDDDPDLKRELVLASGTITPLIRRLAVHDYYALAFAVRRIDDMQRNRIGISPVLLQWSRDDIPRIESAWERTLDRILMSRDFCRSRGIQFLLVYHGSEPEVGYAVDPQGTLSRLKAMGGSHATINWDLTKSVRRVERFCREHKIPMISLLDPLISAQMDTGHQVFGDHYTMFGHLVAAEVLSCALNSYPRRRGTEIARYKSCTTLDFRTPTAPIGVVALPAQQPGVNLVPASSRGLRVR